MIQVCSIGLRFAELVGQFITLIPSSSRKVKDTRAAWSCVLSCIKTNAPAIAPAYGLTIGVRISLRCIAAVISPLANTYRSVRPSKGISVQTMMNHLRTVQLRQCYSLSNFLPGGPHTIARISLVDSAKLP